MAGSDTKPELSFLESGASAFAEIEQLRSRNEQLRARNAELQRIADIGWTAENELRGLRNREAELADEIDTLQNEIRTKAAQSTQFKAQIAQLTQDIETVKAEAARVRKAIETQARAKIVQIKEEYTKRLQEFKREGEIKRSLEQTIAQLTEEIQRAQTAAQSESQRAIAAQKQIAALEDEREDLTTRLDAALAVLKERQIEIERLEAEKFESERHAEEIAANFSRAGGEFANQLAELSEAAMAADVEIQRLRTEIQKREGEKTGLATQVAALEQEIAHWRATAQREQTDRATIERALQTYMAEAQRTSQTQAGENAALEKANRALTQEIESIREALAAQTRESARLDGECSAQGKVIMGQARQLEEASRAIRNREAEIAEWRAQAEGMQTHATNWQKAALDAREDAREAKDETGRYLARISEMSAAAMEKDAEIRKLRAQIEERDAAVSLARKEAAEEKSEAEALRVAMRRQLNVLANVSRSEKEKEEELQALRMQDKGLDGALYDLRKTCAEYERVIKGLNEMVVTQRADFERKLTETRMKNETEITKIKARTDDKLDEQETQFEITISQLKTAYTQEIAELETAHAEEIAAIKTAHAEEIASWRRNFEAAAQDHARAVEDFDRRLQENAESFATADEYVRKEVQRKTSHLTAREIQLRNYAAAISNEKAEILTTAKQLSDEIRSAKALSPLKDYLKVTEFELSKIELQLKKTPAVSLDRPRLEAALSQMLEQRDFLKKAVENSEKALERQARTLARIARPEKLAAIPPLPPKS